jgi:phosphatidylglycerophosphate synthase
MPNAQSIATLLKGTDLATIPNLLSFARIVGVTLAVILYLGGHGWVAVAIGTAAGVTDHLDGYLARRLKQETALGAMLDQVADSFTTAILLAMLVVTGGIPFAYLVIFLLREFWVGTVRRYGATVGIEIPSIALGKMATAVIYNHSDGGDHYPARYARAGRDTGALDRTCGPGRGSGHQLPGGLALYNNFGG